MKKAATGILLAFVFVFAVVSGCTKSKNHAAASLEHAQRVIEKATAEDTQQKTRLTLNKALDTLQRAQVNMGLKNYSFARKQADEAAALAEQALNELK